MNHKQQRKWLLLILQPSTATTPTSSLTQFVASQSASEHGCLQQTFQRAGTTRSEGNFWMATWETIAHFTPALLWLLKWQCNGCRCMPMKMGTNSQTPRRSCFHQVWPNPLCMISMQRSTKNPGTPCQAQPFSNTGRRPANISSFQRYSHYHCKKLIIIMTFLLYSLTMHKCITVIIGYILCYKSVWYCPTQRSRFTKCTLCDLFSKKIPAEKNKDRKEVVVMIRLCATQLTRGNI